MQGKKISGRHTTIIQAAMPVVVAARELVQVHKIVLGLIKPIRGKAVAQSMKVTRVEAGLRLKVRGASSVQELFIYTSEPKSVESLLWRVFE